MALPARYGNEISGRVTLPYGGVSNSTEGVLNSSVGGICVMRGLLQLYSSLWNSHVLRVKVCILPQHLFLFSVSNAKFGKA
jgi:hypothetical protein